MTFLLSGLVDTELSEPTILKQRKTHKIQYAHCKFRLGLHKQTIPSVIIEMRKSHESTDAHKNTHMRRVNKRNLFNPSTPPPYHLPSDSTTLFRLPCGQDCMPRCPSPCLVCVCPDALDKTSLSPLDPHPVFPRITLLSV